MNQFEKGNKVSVSAFKKGPGGPVATIVKGEIFSVIQVDNILQCVTVYGTDTAGTNMKVKTYNDDHSLKLLNPSLV